MPTNLLRLLNNAYKVFARYRRPLALDASPLRDPEKLLRQLTDRPLRLLDVEHVQEYASAALTTVGTVEDYKHFLPRLLDLAVGSGVVEPEIIALKLEGAEWRAWPKKEQQILEEIFVQAAGDAFMRHPDDYIAGQWLVSLAIMNIDLGQVRAEILTLNNDCCALQLAHLLFADTLFESDPLDWAYWSYVSDKALLETRAWLLSEETRTLLLTVRLRIPLRDVWLLDQGIARQEELIQQRLH
jgi:hypothetical protein